LPCHYRNKCRWKINGKFGGIGQTHQLLSSAEAVLGAFSSSFLTIMCSYRDTADNFARWSLDIGDTNMDLFGLA
jgi:hypothetical protein